MVRHFSKAHIPLYQIGLGWISLGLFRYRRSLASAMRKMLALCDEFVNYSVAFNANKSKS